MLLPVLPSYLSNRIELGQIVKPAIHTESNVQITVVKDHHITNALLLHQRQRLVLR